MTKLKNKNAQFRLHPKQTFRASNDFLVIVKASSGNNEATCKISTTKTSHSIRHFFFFEKDKNSDQIAKQNQE